jgi:hypothetical protein
MTRSTIAVFCLVASAGWRPPLPKQSYPPPVQRVLDYLQQEAPLEATETKTPRLALRGADYFDIDGDGVLEVFLWTTPQFQQSPPITAFLVAADGAVERVMEGFAPGPLVSASPKQLDLHTMRIAFDAVAEGQDITPVSVAASAHRLGMHTVRYRSFFHSDMRTFPGYVDMSLVDDHGAMTCEGLGFSPVRGIAAGLEVSMGPLLVALVGDSVYGYEFSDIVADRPLEKSVTVYPIPPDLVSLPPAAGDTLRYLAQDGATKILRLWR